MVFKVYRQIRPHQSRFPPKTKVQVLPNTSGPTSGTSTIYPFCFKLSLSPRCAEIVLRALDLEGARPVNNRVVLEVGCGAGGGSFELSKTVQTVIAVDSSKPLLDAASMMARDGKLPVKCPSTRGSNVTQEVVLDSGVKPGRIIFRQCDPMCLPSGLAGERALVGDCPRTAYCAFCHQ